MYKQTVLIISEVCEHVNCHSQNKGSKWIVCNVCNKTYHDLCVGLWPNWTKSTLHEYVLTHFSCNSCKGDKSDIYQKFEDLLSSKFQEIDQII